MCRIEGSGGLPTRLVDIGRKGEDSDPRLIAPESSVLRYTALSYCWGQHSSTDDCKTLKGNIDNYQLRIPADSIPKTLQDAMSVARALDIRYLWIDLYCIIQDDLTDWEMESAKMIGYYEGAFFTIAATVSTPAEQGFLQKRPEYLVSNIPQLWYLGQEKPLYFCYPEYRNRSDDIEESELSHRGWTMQERLLSQRVLHFSHYGTWFECRSGFKSDGTLLDWLDKLQARWLPQGHTRRELDGRHKEWGRKRYDEWYRMVSDYSQKNPTFPDDKLPALSGLAHKFKDTLGGDEYLVGLWKSDLHRGLLWDNMPSYGNLPSRATNRAPSWAWSSVDGGVYWRHIGYGERSLRPRISVSRTEVTRQSVDPMGRVTNGKIMLSGLVISASLLLPFRGRMHSLLKIDEHGDKFTVESRLQALLIGCGDHFVAGDIWGGDALGKGSYSQTYSGLLLESTGTYRDERAEYRRVGLFEITELENSKDLAMCFEHCVSSRISLV